MDSTTLTILLVVGGLIALYIMIIGTLFLFAFAGEQGFIGLAVFVACWVFMWPVMTGITVLVGLSLAIMQIYNLLKD